MSVRFQATLQIVTAAKEAILPVFLVVLGAILGHCLQLSTMKRQQKAEDERRWLTEKKAGYARLHSELDEFLRELIELVDDLLPAEPASDYLISAIERGQGRTRELWPDVLVSLAALDLLASREVRTAAHEVVGAAENAYSNASRDQDGVYQASKDLRLLKDTVAALVDLMRSDLGVTERFNSA